MLKVIGWYILASAMAHSAYCRLVFKDCPKDIPVITGFEAQKYLGRWYQYSAYWAIFSLGSTCTNAIYTDGTDDEGNFRIRVNNMGLKHNGTKDQAKGYAVPSDPNDPTKAANFIVNFDDRPGEFNSTNYEVLGTDYESYAIVYDCRKSLVEGGSAEFLFILTREKFPPQRLISSVYDSLESMGIETKPLKVTQQEGCPDFPPDCC